jgi:hypothetical protein
MHVHTASTPCVRVYVCVYQINQSIPITPHNTHTHTQERERERRLHARMATTTTAVRGGPAPPNHATLKLVGHLFDSGLINQVRMYGRHGACVA